MTVKRPCGCGERGRHKSTCNKIGIKIIKEKKRPRNCGCGERGRHKPECSLSNKPIPIVDEYEGKMDLQSLYYSAYGKPPLLTWYPDKERQRTVENRIFKLVRRYKAFYLDTKSLETGEDERWYIDGGNWAYNNETKKLIGHVKNCLIFLQGSRPLWYNKRKRSL